MASSRALLTTGNPPSSTTNPLFTTTTAAGAGATSPSMMAAASASSFSPGAPMFTLADQHSASISLSSPANAVGLSQNTDLPNGTISMTSAINTSAITSTATTTTTTMTPLMTTLGGGWRMFWYDHEREKLWKIGLPAFKQCKKKKIHYSNEFASLWYKSPYKYDMVLEAKNIDENTTAQIKLLFADNYEEVKSGSSSQKQTITKNQSHFQSSISGNSPPATTTTSTTTTTTITTGNSSTSAITVGSGTAGSSSSSSKMANIINTTGNGTGNRGNSAAAAAGISPLNGEYDRSVHVGPFQLQVCSFKLERPVCMGIYLSIPSVSATADPSTPNGTSSPHEHSVCCLVSPVFTIKSKKPPQGGKRKKGASGSSNAAGSPPQSQMQSPTPVPSTSAALPGMSNASASSTTTASTGSYSIAGEQTPSSSSASRSTKRSRRSSRGLDNDENADSSSSDDTSDDDEDEEDDANDGHRKRRKALSISTNGNSAFASSGAMPPSSSSSSTTGGMPTTPNSAVASFSKEEPFAPGFQGIGAASTSYLATLSPRSQQLLRAEQNQLLSLINSDPINLQNFEPKFDQIPQQQALDFLQFDYSLQQSNPVLFEDMMTQLTLQTASATDSLSAQQIQSAILSAYGIPLLGNFETSTTTTAAANATAGGTGGAINSSDGSGSSGVIHTQQGINALRSNEILNSFETMSETERHSLLVQLMDKLTIAEREVVRCKLDEYPRIPSAPPM